MPETGNMTYDGDDELDLEGDEAELRARNGNRKKKHRDIDLSEKKEQLASKALRIREGDTDGPKILRSECISATKKEMDKCVRACNRAHEDVCDKLSCSVRSQKALRKECGFNCKKVFDLKVCY